MEQKRFINVYLALGSNQGDRMAIIQTAEALIDRRIGRIARRSSYYETMAWGKTDQGKFVNSVIMINTTLSPREILEANQDIERELGRKHTGERWGPRIVDIDILFYGKRVIRDKGLEIPHPEFHNRMFVLVPMMEIADHFEHPLLKEDMISLYSNCPDTSEVVMIERVKEKVVKPFQNPNPASKLAEMAEEMPNENPKFAKPIYSKPGPRKPSVAKPKPKAEGGSKTGATEERRKRGGVKKRLQAEEFAKMGPKSTTKSATKSAGKPGDKPASAKPKIKQKVQRPVNKSSKPAK
jgi:2-amino-4-hydroxy-6-hydroxymethyldihydropteridine diphosphokinase